MTKRTEFDIRNITRVICSGATAYLAVHFLLLPQLVHWGIGFPAYFYVGLMVTCLLSIIFCLAMRPPQPEEPAHGFGRAPVGRVAPRLRGAL